jgi:hypothetical protein
MDPRLRWQVLFFCIRHSHAYQGFHHFLITKIRKENRPKVFCIGSVKTGTTSLYSAFKIMGYRNVRMFRFYMLIKKNWDEYQVTLKKMIDCKWKPYIEELKKTKYDAFFDFPIGYENLYEAIDKAFPDCKFILTIRDTESFKKSYQNYFRGSPLEIKNPEELNQLIEKFNQRNQKIINYFKNRPGKLLIYNVFEGDEWFKLCSFLNKPIPKKAFPHKNIGKYKKILL